MKNLRGLLSSSSEDRAHARVVVDTLLLTALLERMLNQDCSAGLSWIGGIV